MTGVGHLTETQRNKQGGNELERFELRVQFTKVGYIDIISQNKQ